LIKRLAQKTPTASEFNELIKKHTGLFVFNKSISGLNLAFGAIKKYILLMISTVETIHFISNKVENGNGFYLCVKKTFAAENDHDSIVTVGMIPVMYRYFAGLPERFEYSDDAASKISISALPTDYPVKSISGDTFFYVSPKIQPGKPSESIATTLKLDCYIVIADYIHFMAEKNSKAIWILERDLFFYLSS
jgi:hypothetical protein